MAKYIYKNKAHNINLLQFDYTAYFEYDEILRLGWDYKDKTKGYAPSLSELVKYDKDTKDENMYLYGIYIYFHVDENGNAVLNKAGYEKGYNGIDFEEVPFILNKKETRLFQRILANDKEWR